MQGKKNTYVDYNLQEGPLLYRLNGLTKFLTKAYIQNVILSKN